MSQYASELPFSIDAQTVEGDPDYTPPVFPILPFKPYRHNPILTPDPAYEWQEAYLYNPTAVVLGGTIFLMFRAQNAKLKSSIGLAWSTDGVTFTRLDKPILTASLPSEQGGGVEDPRIVRIKGTFYMTYTCWNLKTPMLGLAYGQDLLSWEKTGPLFPLFPDIGMNAWGEPTPRKGHSKSGAIIAEPTADGVYHMIFGEGNLYEATSADLIHWTPQSSEEPWAVPVHPWEDGLLEPGPAPIKTRDGKWLLVYNAKSGGRGGYPAGQYSTGQMLLDPSGSCRPNFPSHDDQPNPANRNGPIARLDKPCLVPTTVEEKTGQVDQVVFSEGLVQFKGKWFLYYGQSDSSLGVAIADVQI